MTALQHPPGPTAAHVRYRARLQAAADPEAWARLLGPGWTRHAARFEPWQQPWATLVLERVATTGATASKAMLVVAIYDEGSEPAGARPSALGPLVIVPLEDDHTLVGLPAMLARRPRLEVVRYRPGRRCTLRLADADAGNRTDPADPAFVKLFDATTTAERTHREAKGLWAASLRGELPFAMARPGSYDVELRAVWQHRVAGEPVLSTLGGPDATALCVRLGSALGALATAEVAASSRIDAAAQIARTARALARATRCCADAAPRLDAVWRRLQQDHVSAGRGTVGVVHGSPHHHQWLDDGERLGLVDFDRLGVGDVELDAATLLAELDFESACRDRVDELTDALCAGYANAGVVLNRSLLQLYRRHKWLAKIGRTSSALRADGDARVRRVLDRFETLLEATA